MMAESEYKSKPELLLSVKLWFKCTTIVTHSSVDMFDMIYPYIIMELLLEQNISTLIQFSVQNSLSMCSTVESLLIRI